MRSVPHVWRLAINTMCAQLVLFLCLGSAHPRADSPVNGQGGEPSFVLELKPSSLLVQIGQDLDLENRLTNTSGAQFTGCIGTVQYSIQDRTIGTGTIAGNLSGG